uniref:Uncharacterized protein n=1 Tax=Spironucleus salmonicida TaxID=348837 RepID=V6LTU2_9EUKA|eukprot:EST44179.1 Hypothetical protein SS50377_15983 [Spironucleus salmonicida]
MNRYDCVMRYQIGNHFLQNDVLDSTLSQVALPDTVQKLITTLINLVITITSNIQHALIPSQSLESIQIPGLLKTSFAHRKKLEARIVCSISEETPYFKRRIHCERELPCDVLFDSISSSSFPPSVPCRTGFSSPDSSPKSRSDSSRTRPLSVLHPSPSCKFWKLEQYRTSTGRSSRSKSLYHQNRRAWTHTLAPIWLYHQLLHDYQLVEIGVSCDFASGAGS